MNNYEHLWMIVSICECMWTTVSDYEHMWVGMLMSDYEHQVIMSDCEILEQSMSESKE
jgi:hypothetical protein